MTVRKEIFEKFWNLSAKVRHWDYIAKHTTCRTPTKKTSHGKKKSKGVTREYSLPVKGKHHRVCKTFFVHTLGITGQWIKSALAKDTSAGSAPADLRGKHDNRPTRASEETKNSVRDHINSIPRVDAHYVREKSRRQYIDCTLSIKKLHKEYIKWMDSYPVECKKASERKYREIFLTEFNIGNYIPRKDQCLKCVKWKVASIQEKAKMAREYAIHRANRRKSHQAKALSKEEAMEKSDRLIACFDLQKVLPLPRTEIGDAFYLNKINLYNFTILDLCRLEGVSYPWLEVMAGRGAKEVLSHIRHYVIIKIQEGIKIFHFFSDSCTGQNKNRQVFCTYVWLSAKLKVRITHTFLEPGHTYMEVDSMHALIERREGRSLQWMPGRISLRKPNKTEIRTLFTSSIKTTSLTLNLS